MEKGSYVGPLLLLDSYDDAGRMLHESFVQAGYDGPVVVVNDDGFLPDGTLSVYDSLCSEGCESPQGKPRYFNQIDIPDFWEIEATGSSAKVSDRESLRARIFFAEPVLKRFVKTVDWLDANGNVRYSDHYNRFGRCFARTTFDKKGQRFCKTYFSSAGREVVVDNYGTRTISVMLDGKIHYFQRPEELFVFFFERRGIFPTRLFYNSLGVPLFVAGRISAKDKGNVLFWQEAIKDEIPDNMASVMSEDRWSTGSICVQTKSSYERLRELGADTEIIKPLGFVYDFAKENKHTPNALVCTNSEDVEKIVELVTALPEVHFNIAAVTEMSSKLMSMGRYPNVRLFPTVQTDVLDGLFMECDIYLDINHYAEIVSAVKRAFLHNHLIVAFDETLHSTQYVAREHVFTDYRDMVVLIGTVLSDERIMQKHIEAQRSWALSEDSCAYAEILGKRRKEKKAFAQ